ncbi:MAG: NRDE family protein [Verrucomicrobiota bacterium]|nr:NRDE family protein [Verrucomicrobiota bacterium]
MCTATFYPFEDGRFLLFFNRDESRARPKATRPDLTIVNNVQCLFPSDPAASGTWLAVQENGIVACIINGFSKTQRHGEKSRSRIIKKLLGSLDEEELRVRFGLLNLPLYAPFQLITFIPKPKRDPKILSWKWDGRMLHSYHSLSGPQIWAGSNEGGNDPSLYRKILWQEFLLKNPQMSPEALHNFHFSTDQQPDARTVTMKRSESRTVSVSELTVSSESIEFTYYNNSPWKAPVSTTDVLSIREIKPIMPSNLSKGPTLPLPVPRQILQKDAE